MISGIVVASRPEDQEEVRRAIEALDYADVHYGDSHGRLVVTVEAPGIEASMERVEAIGRIPGVVAVSLAQYCMEDGETEPMFDPPREGSGEPEGSEDSRDAAQSPETKSKSAPLEWRQA